MNTKFADNCRKLIESGVCHSDCCGFWVFSNTIWNENKDKARDVKEVTKFENETIAIGQNGKCVFLKENLSCAIYNHRPDVCRNYGLTKELECPYIKENGNLRSPAQVKRVQRKINHMVDDRMKSYKKKYNIS